MKFKELKLIVFVFVSVLTPLVFVGCGGTQNPPEPNIIIRVLMSQAEIDESRNWKFSEVVNHAKSDRKYADTGVFLLANNYGWRPALFVRTINLDAETISDRQINVQEAVSVGILQMEQNDKILFMIGGGGLNGYLVPRDITNNDIDEIVTLTYQVWIDGNHVVTLSIPLLIIRDPL